MKRYRVFVEWSNGCTVRKDVYCITEEGPRAAGREALRRWKDMHGLGQSPHVEILDITAKLVER